ncbi:PREDICTED: protein PET100 homolog, mitochondrial, partial [Tinamus guttatus]|uniref:protein PET100 homolog, mitochondrial n=1 Tax=Tinamus guttatus TaxID=94827 RepID=UPI00052EEA24
MSPMVMLFVPMSPVVAPCPRGDPRCPCPQMLLYLSFPVSMFWVSNQGGYFEERVERRKREIFPPDDPER